MKRKLTIAVMCAASSALLGQTPQTSQQPNTYSPLSGIHRAGTGTGASDGVLYSDFHVSQILDFFGNSNVNSRQAVSGDFSLGSMSERNDLQFRYNGGAVFASGSNSRDYNFHQLDVSDSFQLKRVGVLVGDTFTYTPDTFGFTGGIPGIGNIGSFLGLGGLNPGLFPQQGLILQGTTRISNASFVQGDYSVTQRTSITGSVSYGLSKYPDFPAFNGTQIVYSGGADYRLTARTSVAVNYDHSNFNYDNSPQKIKIDSGNVSISHLFSKALSLQGSIGPQFIQRVGLPDRHSIGGAAVAHYLKGKTSYSLHYSHGANSGSFGVLGAEQDQAGVIANRTLTRNWNVAFNASYTRASGLSGHQTFHNEQFGLQTDRHFTRRVSGYASYTYRHQASNINIPNLPTSVLTGNSHTIGLGLTFTPRGLRLKRS